MNTQAGAQPIVKSRAQTAAQSAAQSRPRTNIVFLSPHFPANFYTFCLRLREAGANVLGLGDAPYASLRPELHEALSEYYRVSDMHHYDELLRALGHFTHKHGKIEWIDSLSEHWLETEAQLRTDFNISGLKTDTITRMKRKSEMKEVFRKAKLRPARGLVAQTAEEVREFARKVGFPIVAKPDIGVGAAKTYKITDETALEQYLETKPEIDYILEEFIEGAIVTYDGLTDRDGTVVFDSSLVYSAGIMEVVNEGGDVNYYSERVIPEDLVEIGQRVARAFDVRERFFHFEFFRLPNGSLVPLEVNIRPPGGLSVDMMNFANDIDIYKMWAEIVVHGHTEIRAERPYFTMYVSRKNHKHYALSHEQVLERFGDFIIHHEQISGIFSAAIGDQGYVLRAPSLEPLHEAARAIQQKI